MLYNTYVRAKAVGSFTNSARLVYWRVSKPTVGQRSTHFLPVSVGRRRDCNPCTYELTFTLTTTALAQGASKFVMQSPCAALRPATGSLHMRWQESAQNQGKVHAPGDSCSPPNPG